MYKMLVVLLSLCLFFGFALAQGESEWVWDDVVINGYTIATDEGEAKVNLPGFKNPYSVAVDPDGKVWTGAYYSRRLEGTVGLPDLERYPDLWYEIAEKDTGTGPYLDTTEVWNKPIWVWDPADGEIDTIHFLTLPDQTIDTLTAGHRGMERDHEGNIIVGMSDGAVYKINYLTYECMAKYSTGGSNGRMGVDAEGFVFQMDGVYAETCHIIDPLDFTLYNQITGISASVTRCAEVSPDGKHYFIGSSSGGAHHFYSADGVDGTYALVDTIQATYWLNDTTEKVLYVNLAQWHPSGLLYLAGYQDAEPYVVLASDPDQDFMIVDTLDEFVMWTDTDESDTTSGGYAKPQYWRCIRDAEFNADGSTMWAADFYGYTIKKWNFMPATSIQPDQDSKTVPGTFTLYHNYPNPFNPTTTIPFDLHKQAHVKLKVYNSLGQEVGTYIDEVMNMGSHKFIFDGSNLASGTYYFKMTVDTKVATGKMMLIK